MKIIAHKGFLLSIILALILPFTLAGPEIPTDASKVDSWYSQAIGSASSRKGTIDPNLETAEASPVLIKVRQDGSGQFKSVQAAVDSVKTQNTVRTIIDIGPGEYKEKIKVERFKPYITFLGDAKNRPTLTYSGNAAKYGTFDSATVIVEADYFVAANIIFSNTSPRPTQEMSGAQALALRIGGEKAAFYNCRMLGFQDTLCDDTGKHFYKDCYIEGTVDFVFGDGQSIYLNCELHVIEGDLMAVITAQGRDNKDDQGGYAIVHGSVTGKGGRAALGRSWMPAAKVVYLHTTLSEAVDPAGWNDHRDPKTQKTVYFAEFQTKGPGANQAKRVPYATKITEKDAKTYMTLDYIEGMKWLLPPPTAKGAAPTSTAKGAAPETKGGDNKSKGKGGKNES